MASGDFSIGSRLWPGISRVTEEAGELLAVCGKLIGSHGDTDHFDGTDLKRRLEEEIADLQAALIFVVEKNHQLDRQAIIQRRGQKLEQYQLWHRKHLAADEPPTADLVIKEGDECSAGYCSCGEKLGEVRADGSFDWLGEQWQMHIMRGVNGRKPCPIGPPEL